LYKKPESVEYGFEEDYRSFDWELNNFNCLMFMFFVLLNESCIRSHNCP